jgi:nucleoid-associated protein YgaU
MKKIMIALAALSLSLVSWANDDAFRSDHPDEYTVVKGDTLWDISNRFLNTPWLWPEIWHVNPRIENPHLIYPGDVIHLVYIDGQPRLTVERTLRMAPGDTRLSPSVRVVSRDDAITTIPLDRINSFLSRSRIVTDAELEAAPYMLAGPEQRLIVGAGDRAYARGEFDDDIHTYGAYRRERAFVDPQTREYLGSHAKNLGTVNLIATEGDIGTVQVVRSSEEIRPTDRLLPGEQLAMDSTFYPSAPDVEIEGIIMEVEGGVSNVGKMSVIMINRGDREGLLAGNVLAVYKVGETVRDRVRNRNVKLPDERAGLVMVFRTFEKMSLAIVLEAERPLAVNDRLRNP